MMKVVLFTACAASVLAGPAKDALEELQRSMPSDLEAWALERVASGPQVAQGVPKVLIIGDSWADVVGMNGNESYFEKKLAEHGCQVSSRCIAIPGSTSDMWATGAGLTALKAAVKLYQPDYVWGTLVGNDALDSMPDCAKQGKSEAECADELMEKAVPNMLKVVDAVHEAAPHARVTGFGYDTMFGGLGCSVITHDVFPQCWAKGVPRGSGNRCFNTQFLRIQEGWGYIAGNRSDFVDVVSILGATQVAAGDPKASTDDADRHINMDKMGPAKYWPTTMACFHPGIGDGDDVGAMVVMEEFHRVYWSKQLTCTVPAVSV